MRADLQKLLAVAAVGSLVIAWSSHPSEPPSCAARETPEASPIPVRILAKRSIGQAVIDRRLSLTEAAALWVEVIRLSPGGPGPAFVGEYGCTGRPPPRSDEERLCRQVIDWVDVMLDRESPAKADEVRGRLEAAFLRWRDLGTNRLPNPSDVKPPAAELLAEAVVAWAAECRGSRPACPKTSP